MKRKRLIGLDVFRILAALIIYLFHSYAHMGYYYGWLEPFIRSGPIMMSGFFMLSGFSLFYTNQEKNLMQLTEMKLFYKKRFVGIMPVYYVVAVLYTVLLGKESLIELLVLIPVQILGLQSTINGMFSMSHNSGTWFISCLVICYVLYPFMQEVLKQLGIKTKLFFVCMCYFILAWAAIVVWKFKLGYIYTEPFFRGLEFFMGAALASGMKELEKKKCFAFFQKWWVFFLELIVLFLSVTFAVKKDFAVGNYMTYDMFCLPIFIMMLFTLAGVSSGILEKSRLLAGCSKISYLFFLAQYFTWPMSRWIFAEFFITNAKLRIIISFVICLLISVLLYELAEKPLKRWCRRFIK